MDTIHSEMMRLIKERFEIGRKRYGHGLLHKSNDSMNFRKESLEELLDAVIYSAADYIRSIPQVSVLLDHDHDNGTVKLNLRVNRETEHDDGESALVNIIDKVNTNRYDHASPVSLQEQNLLLCSMTLCFLLKHLE